MHRRFNVMSAAVALAAAMAGCWPDPSPPCASNENYCVGDTAHTCVTNESEGTRSTHQCDPITQACISGSCNTLTDMPCDPAGDACDPSGHSAYRVCAKGFYVFEIACSDSELCTVTTLGTNYAACAITPFESCNSGPAVCRDNRVVSCDPTLGLLHLRDDCGPNGTCRPRDGLDAWCS